MLTAMKNESYFSFNQVIVMKGFFLRNLMDSADLIASIFDKKMDEVIATIETLSGTEEEMLAQFFIELTIPLNQYNYKILSAIAHRHLTM